MGNNSVYTVLCLFLYCLGYPSELALKVQVNVTSVLYLPHMEDYIQKYLQHVTYV